MTKQIYSIKLATPRDVEVCIRLSMKSWPEWWKHNKRAGSDFIKMCVGGKTCLVAVDRERRTFGFFVWSPLWNKIHIDDIFLEKKWRRMGIATEFLNTAIKMSKARGMKEVVSDCDVSNKESIVWHLKNGFVKTGRIKGNWDGEDSVTFARQI